MNFKGKSYNYFTKERKPDRGYCLYGWGTYPSHSVLAGQESKSYLAGFDTDEEIEAFMAANEIEGEWSNQWTERQISYNHLNE
tara:strand:- start:269 stop:517 length:249 start_codon:yes stop_codon:yes gene_type:complete